MNEKGRWNGLPLVIFGSGGISREVAQLVEDINKHSPIQVFDLLGFVEKHASSIGKRVQEFEVITSDDLFADFAGKFQYLGVAIPQGLPSIKVKIYEEIQKAGLNNVVFPNLIHPSVGFDNTQVSMGIGNIICRNSIITVNVKIGSFNLINANVLIGHDVVIEDYCVINSLSVISGNVLIHNEVTVGAGSSILQGIELGQKAVIGIGSSVIKHVPESTTAMGVPAINIKKM